MQCKMKGSIMYKQSQETYTPMQYHKWESVPKNIKQTQQYKLNSLQLLL